MRPRELTRRLWGELYFHPDQRVFRRTAPRGGAAERSFVQFVLEPLYKVYSQVLGEYPYLGGGWAG